MGGGPAWRQGQDRRGGKGRQPSCQRETVQTVTSRATRRREDGERAQMRALENLVHSIFSGEKLRRMGKMRKEWSRASAGPVNGEQSARVTSLTSALVKTLQEINQELACAHFEKKGRLAEIPRNISTRPARSSFSDRVTTLIGQESE